MDDFTRGAQAFNQSRTKEIIDNAQIVNKRGGQALSPEAQMAALAAQWMQIQMIPIPSFRAEMEEGFRLICETCTGDLLQGPSRLAMFKRIMDAFISDMNDLTRNKNNG